MRDVQTKRLKHVDRRASRKEIEQYREVAYASKRKTNKVLGCSCNAGFVSGVVLDPFMGSGTTALVARKHGRRFVGFEVKPEYVEMARERLANAEVRKTARAQ